ncbi:MAG: response regulator transcription factor, partial [Alphaproteobacteria bacterium]|nr:response regulator transcription factor [Alphaproteobacteria bacterium]
MMTTPDTPMIFVVDDDEAVRDSLKILLETEGYRATAFESAVAFLDGWREGMRGCLLADVRMPDMTGLELQEVVIERRLGLPVIIITGHGDVPMAVRAMKAGAVDFIEKPFSDTTILDSVRRAMEASAHAGAAQGASVEALQRLESLTPRERQVLECLVRGRPNKVIAYELDISPRTVEIHRARVMEKM